MQHFKQICLVFLIVLVLVLPGVCVQAAVYHVSPQGSNDDAGKEQSPWQTIRKAAETMAAGDTCIVHEGVYRETVKPARSGTVQQPIRFVAAEGEEVLVTGTEAVSRWSVHKGNIRVAEVDWPVEQVFVGRKLMTPARFPNASDNPYELKLLNVTIDSGKYVLEGLSGAKDFWKGGYLWGMNSKEWVAQTVSVTDSEGKTVTVEGKGPDIGCFEYGIETWTAGSTLGREVWMEKGW